ncbi:hypothetical protein FPQ18DRAFT_356864 [Pyronema domesticum]|uniref:Similar to Cell growth-regulated gene 1 protein acc. no. P56553 n=1 Tax=Pyronema omphalodes (strain CBS 100304) TaxID=1076935 RepID=U4LD62_PYROM|nr:hypothetical protein FPQ18DRAFT_356864 [Pyronema domesticum]CCX30059.1 Similar to Cell growth-regulated gene 1 protein; acc. no. P56553 [Pyronema omphalodes CBS 100304]
MSDEHVETISINEPYLNITCALGEGPFYDAKSNTLRFVDIIRKELHTVNLEQGPGSHAVLKLKDSVGVTANIAGAEHPDNVIMVAAKYGFAKLNTGTGELEYLKRVYEGEKAERMRFNDGICDSRGRFWAGSMNDFHVGEPQPEGTIYRYDPSGTLQVMIDNVTIPNGMGWSPDERTMYITDSPTRCIHAYDYEPIVGSISNRRVFYSLPEEEKDTVLDGCTVDTDGNVWAAVHEGGRVIKISPEGKVVKQVKLGAWRITCPAFGRGGEMFVTTAGVEEGENAPEGSVGHGAVWRFETGAKGGHERNMFGVGVAS